MTDERQDVLTAFVSYATEYGEGAFADAVAAAAPRLEDVANGTVVVLSPPDVQARKLLLEAQNRRNLDDAVELAKAAGWRIDPPRQG
ncbi:hypothetical protein [Patulibacter sp.]|uniref:hypothetical protein n=1 Tax=Patulibacter sp. TaxID=1912859 RepID=UPI002728CC23|nr:hypothetical protein [Patulibacter sp.]MDO9410421.1 hypothetical protein [Patulibacter sp.]